MLHFLALALKVHRDNRYSYRVPYHFLNTSKAFLSYQTEQADNKRAHIGLLPTPTTFL